MVNLLTGDFNFNLPILEVPGPEGNFAIPLSYHAGIGPEQEASWTGLGWNINAGAIARNINQFPDDASGEEQYVTAQDFTGTTGWNRVFNHPFRDDWNSQTGYHGNINLLDLIEVDFGNRTDVGIGGIHVADGGVSVDPVQFIQAGATVATMGMGAVGTGFATVAKQAAIDLTINAAVSFAMPINTPGAPTAGSWSYSKATTGRSYQAHWKTSLLFGTPIVSRKKSWKIWLDHTRVEDMNGVLYLQSAEETPGGSLNVLTNNVNKTRKSFSRVNYEGATSDINFAISSGSYNTQSPPTVLATDSYLVNAPGVSGSIKPYRLEAGSVAMPKEMSEFYSSFNLMPYLDYKVPFIYEGGISNKYYHHVGNNTSNPFGYVYGMDIDIGQGAWDYKLDDAIFGSANSERIRQDIEPIKKVPQGNHIEWVKNDDITFGTVQTGQWPSGFIDFLSGEGLGASDRYAFRIKTSDNATAYKISYSASIINFTSATQIPVKDPSFLQQLSNNVPLRITISSSSPVASITVNATIVSTNSTAVTINSMPDLAQFIGRSVNLLLEYDSKPDMSNGIGGFTITSADGTGYHFALPVYGYDERSEMISISDANKRSIVSRYFPFAYTWLLTAITGPDFIDRNGNQMVDVDDWGHWVKFNYGRHQSATDYEWRIPYTGEIVSSEGTVKGYERGKKQLYYLNSIETRSHVALFMKSERADGVSAQGGIAPLRLDEICLLQRKHYEQLYPDYAISKFSNKVDVLCQTSQFAPSGVRNFVNRNCVKRVCFNYDYSLCKNTPNTIVASNPQKGKLTLKSISIRGRNDLKVVPDYKFEYTSNQNYNSSAWDGWGMNGGGRLVNQQFESGSDWSLSKIITPLGGEISVNYERDTYSSISGEQILDTPIGYGKANFADGPEAFRTIHRQDDGYFNVGDDIVITQGSALYTCPANFSYSSPFSGQYTVASVNPTSITLTSDFVNSGCGSNGIFIEDITASITKVLRHKKGGNLRVGSVVITDETGKESKQRYLYTTEDGFSSGVVSVEPEYIRTNNFYFYDYLRYPQTPVIYGRVSVLNGKLSSDDDYYSKQVFEFKTPHQDQLIFAPTDQGSTSHIFKKLFKFIDRTSEIGKLKSVKIYNKNGMTAESQLTYTSQVSSGGGNYNGVYSEGTLMSDFSSVSGGSSFAYRINRTTVVTHPYTIKKITNSKDGFVSYTENLDWDLLTGKVLQKVDKSSLGVYIKTVIKPAYKETAYAELGSKAYNTSIVNNRNMLLADAATYQYRSDASGSNLRLIGAEIQTWKKNWDNYRHYNGTGYIDLNEQVSINNPVWRKGPAYVWKGDYSLIAASTDGTYTFSPSDEFNFSTTPSNLWQYTGEILRFDHFGMPLESKDMNDIHSSVKLGYNDQIVIAAASNAEYNEMAFSSAEDIYGDKPFFGGEIAIGNGTVKYLSKGQTTTTHTGDAIVSLPSSGYSFKYKTTGLKAGKRYRASVWTNSVSGRIYYKINGSEELSDPPSPAKLVNGWYRIDLELSKTSDFDLEIGVKSLADGVYFDDFRFQPSESVMVCYVYPPSDFTFTASSPIFSNYTYVLDNQNLYTKFEHNERGVLTKTYKESLKHGVKLLTESKENFRRFTIE